MLKKQKLYIKRKPKSEIDGERQKRINERKQKIDKLEKNISERKSKEYEGKDQEEINYRNQQDQNEIDFLNQQNLDQSEQIVEDNQISLRTRIKFFFKEHGVVTAVFLSVSAVITDIILNLTSGLKNTLKKVGNGLKYIGKKLVILPGIIGSIVNFIFSAASEVIGFLVKNVWLLILAVVIYFVEQFKKKNQ